MIRYLTSMGGPPEVSSWTVTSRVSYQVARDLGEFWEWQMLNATLPQNFDRPLLSMSFEDERHRIQKLLVQA